MPLGLHAKLCNPSYADFCNPQQDFIDEPSAIYIFRSVTTEPGLYSRVLSEFLTNQSVNVCVRPPY